MQGRRRADLPSSETVDLQRQRQAGGRPFDRTPGYATPASTVLHLQRVSGNRSVRTLLEVQRTRGVSTPLDDAIKELLKDKRSGFSAPGGSYVGVPRAGERMSGDQQSRLAYAILSALWQIPQARRSAATVDDVLTSGEPIEQNFGLSRKAGLIWKRAPNAKEKQARAKKIRDAIDNVLGKTENGLRTAKNLEIADVNPKRGPKNGKVRGYVRGATGRIHIDFGGLRVGDEEAVTSWLIHEATHKFAATKDKKYRDQDGYQKLSVDKAIQNADSFAGYVQDVTKRRTSTTTDGSEETSPVEGESLPYGG